MPSLVSSRVVAMLGMLGLLPIGLGLVRHTLTLQAAAGRAAVLLGVLVLLEMVVIPLGQLVLAPPHRREEDTPAG